MSSSLEAKLGQPLTTTQLWQKGCIHNNKLTELIKQEYAKRGFKEVKTPNLYNIDLWKVSGHYRSYKDDLYLLPSTSAGE